MSASPTPPPPSAINDPASIDRQTTTPFLLNFCYRSSAFHNLADFPIPSPSQPRPTLPAHLQIYTWYSCTLKELAHLLTTTLPTILPDPAVGTRLSFRLVYPDTSGAAGGRGGRLGGEEGRARYASKEMGSVVISVPASTHERSSSTVTHSYELGGDDADKTLADVRFVIGDFIDCAVFPPLSDGSVVPRGNTFGRGGFRENGYGRSRGHSYAGGIGGRTYDRGNSSAAIPTGEWRRGERLPEAGPYRGRGGPGGAGYGGGRGGRREPY